MPTNPTPAPRKVQQWEILWTVKHINSLRIGGIWVIPRCGIIFTRTGEDEVTLTDVTPFMAQMARAIMGDGEKLTSEKLLSVQQEEFFNVAARLRAGGFIAKSAVPAIKEEE